jgi:hypothetical protein
MSTSIEAIPREVHVIVLSFLSSTEIYKLYQPVCKAWYAIAAQETTTLDGVKISYYRESENMLASIASRFPNLKRINLKQSHIVLQSKVKEMRCPLELVINSDSFFLQHIVFCDDKFPKQNPPIEDSVTWKTEILSKFPHYRAINISLLSMSGSSEQILKDLEEQTITHVVFSKSLAHVERLTTIFDRVLPTMTHLLVDAQTTDDAPAIWDFILDRVSKYTGELQIEHICNALSGTSQWESILARTPKLKSYFGAIGPSTLDQFAKYSIGCT